jgi:hypothetical protein
MFRVPITLYLSRTFAAFIIPAPGLSDISIYMLSLCSIIMVSVVSVSDLNRMDLDPFVLHLGSLIQHFPVVAASVYSKRPFHNKRDLTNHVWTFIDTLPKEGTNYPIVGGKCPLN